MNRVDVMKACLAEAGFPDVEVTPDCGDPNGCACGWPTVHFPSSDCEPLERATHKAFLLMGCPSTPGCFNCWSDWALEQCEHFVPTTP